MNHLKKILIDIRLFFRKKIKEKEKQKINNLLTEHEKICFEIFRKYLYMNDSKLLMSPEITDIGDKNSYKRYIYVGKLNNPDVAIVMTHTNIKIINHTYFYSIDISRELYKKMSSMFDRKIIKERNMMEQAIYKNITDGLSSLKNK